MRLAIDWSGSSVANAFATFGVEGDWFFVANDEAFVHGVEHFEQRRMGEISGASG